MQTILRRVLKRGREKIVVGHGRRKSEVAITFRPTNNGMLFKFNKHKGHIKQECNHGYSLEGIEDILVKEATTIFLNAFSTKEDLIEVGKTRSNKKGATLVITMKS